VNDLFTYFENKSGAEQLWSLDTLEVWQKDLISQYSVYVHIIGLSLNMIQMTPTRSNLEVLDSSDCRREQSEYCFRDSNKKKRWARKKKNADTNKSTEEANMTVASGHKKRKEGGLVHGCS